jgi:hypothetical protein
VRGDPKVQEKVFQQWNLNGTGPLATNGIEAGVKVRPTEDELKEMDSWPCPEFRSGWDSYFKNKPDKPVMHYCEYFLSRVTEMLALRGCVSLRVSKFTDYANRFLRYNNKFNRDLLSTLSLLLYFKNAFA